MAALPDMMQEVQTSTRLWDILASRLCAVTVAIIVIDVIMRNTVAEGETEHAMVITAVCHYNAIISCIMPYTAFMSVSTFVFNYIGEHS